MGVRVDGVREARLAATALRRADPALRREATAQIRTAVNPIWRESVESGTSSRVETAVLRKGARVTAGARPALNAATSRRPLRGGLVPAESWRAFEFGARRNVRETYRGRRGSTRFDVTRRTRRQLPPVTKGGRVLYPAVADALPRVASLWAQTAVWVVFESLREAE